jgi:hypothetical protein
VYSEISAAGKRNYFEVSPETCGNSHARRVTTSQRLLYGCITIYLNMGFLVATLPIGFMI